MVCKMQAIVAQQYIFVYIYPNNLYQPIYEKSILYYIYYCFICGTVQRLQERLPLCLHIQ